MSVVMIGCTTDYEEYEGIEISSNPEVVELLSDLELSETENITVCSCTDSIMTISVGDSIKTMKEGPAYDTNYLILYDYENDNLIKRYDFNCDEYICSAVPYKEGIVYATYEWIENEDYPLEWEIAYTDGKQTTTLDKGECYGFEKEPLLKTIDGEVIFSYEDGSGDQYECGIKTIVDNSVKPIIEETGCYLNDIYFRTNGKEYVIFVSRGEDETGTLIIGDMNGKISEHIVPGKITDYSINAEYAICGIGNDDENNCSVFFINLKTLNTEEVTTGVMLYRIGEGTSNYFMAINGNVNTKDLNVTEWQMCLIDPNEEVDVIKEIERPEEINAEETSYVASTESEIIMKVGNDLYMVRLF